MHLHNTGKSVFEACMFDRNTALGSDAPNGGAVYVAGAETTFKDCVFTKD